MDTLREIARRAPIAVVRTTEEARDAGRRGKWRKTSRSYDIGTCVEVLTVPEGTLFRDTEYRNDTILDFGQGEWAAMMAATK